MVNREIKVEHSDARIALVTVQDGAAICETSWHAGYLLKENRLDLLHILKAEDRLHELSQKSRT